MAPPAELFSKIPSDGFDNDTPETCRERRNRRIKIRRLISRSGFGPNHSPSNNTTQNQEIQHDNSDPGLITSKRYHTEEEEESSTSVPALSRAITLGGPPLPPTPPQLLIVAEESSLSCSVRGPVPNPMPIHGWISTKGLAESMEDMLMVKENFCQVAGDHISGQPMHYFAVYDGHGGSRVSTLCKDVLHKLIVEELMLVWTAKRAVATENGDYNYNRSRSYSSPQEKEQQELFERKREWIYMVRNALLKSFQRMDQMAHNTCSCGKNGSICRCKPMELNFAGSTAVVAMITPRHIVVANCGDSRAVLCRGGKVIPLSQDHKPDRPSERERILAAGGTISYNNGARVNGILNLSRSLGDTLLKPIVTSRPGISFMERNAEDECIIIASDGLWDAISNDLACKVTIDCLRREELKSGCSIKDDDDIFYPSKSSFAAAILCRLALSRRSSDNISVIVVDLKRHKNSEAE